MFVPDLRDYRRFLSAFSDQIAQYDGKCAQVTKKWLKTLDVLEPSGCSRYLAIDHSQNVARIAPALVILAVDRSSIQPSSEARVKLKAAEEGLLSEIKRLREEMRFVESVLTETGLERLVGEFMSSVEFVMDYLQLRFSDASLTAYRLPDVISDDFTLRPAETGYRDALCGLIGVTVESTKVVEGETLSITFTGGKSLVIPLSNADGSCPETVEFWARFGGFWSW
jgi:hypothetical protein